MALQTPLEYLGGQKQTGEAVLNAKINALVDAVNARTLGQAAAATTTLTTATGAQISTSKDVQTHTPITFTNALADGTCTVAVAPLDAGYVTLAVVTRKTFTGAVNGDIHDVVVNVPAGWFLKLTVANATIGTTTYF